MVNRGRSIFRVVLIEPASAFDLDGGVSIGTIGFELDLLLLRCDEESISKPSSHACGTTDATYYTSNGRDAMTRNRSMKVTATSTRGQVRLLHTVGASELL